MSENEPKIEWRAGTGEYRRANWCIDGYDDVADGGTRHCDSWVYAVARPLVGLVLHVDTGRWKGQHAPSCGRMNFDVHCTCNYSTARPIELLGHIGLPPTIEDIRSGALPRKDCCILSDGCYENSYTWLGLAKDFYGTYARAKQIGQDTAFWTAFESLCDELMLPKLAEAQKLNAEHAQCPTCKGVGTVRR